MKKHTLSLLILLSFSSSLYGGVGDKEESYERGHIVVQMEDKEGDRLGTSNLIQLDTGIVTEEFIQRPSLLRRLAGYLMRGAIIGGTTVIGGGIGAAIIAGEFNSTVASVLLRTATPIFIGSAVGCGLGCLGGNYAKKRFVGR